MYFNLKCLVASIALALFGCGYDTGVRADYDDNTIIRSSSSFDRYWFQSSSSNTATIAKAYFPTDLEYIGIFKHSRGASLVMKNNTAYYMSVSVNYTISCSVNGNPSETTTRTLYFSFDAYEQNEHSSSIDGHYHGGLNTIVCSGTILSIIPYSYDESNFQSWTGSYPISTK